MNSEVNTLASVVTAYVVGATRLKAEQITPTFEKQKPNAAWRLQNLQVRLASNEQVVGYVYFPATGYYFKPNQRAVEPKFFVEYLHVLEQVQRLLTLREINS